MRNRSFTKIFAGLSLLCVAALGSANSVGSVVVDNPTIIGGTSGARTVTVNFNRTSNGTRNVTLTIPGVLSTAQGTTLVFEGNTVTKQFTFTAPNLVTADTNVDIVAQYQATAPQSATVTVKNLFAKSIGWGKAMVQGQSYIGQVNLNAITGADRTITLSSNNAGVTVPSSVQVIAGQKQAFFNISVDAAASGSVTIDATFNGSTVGRTQMVKTLMVSSIALDNTVVTGGDPVVGTVTLNTVVSVDTVVNLTSQNAGVATVPATVTILAGNNSATFDITTFVQLSTKSSKITASSFNNSRAVRLYVNPITP